MPIFTFSTLLPIFTFLSTVNPCFFALRQLCGSGEAGGRLAFNRRVLQIGQGQKRIEKKRTGPTPVQEQAWEAVEGGESALVIAPTGSGKTLAAFLFLYLIESYVTQAGGAIEVADNTPRGAIFSLFIPATGTARHPVQELEDTDYAT